MLARKPGKFFPGAHFWSFEIAQTLKEHKNARSCAYVFHSIYSQGNWYCDFYLNFKSFEMAYLIMLSMSKSVLYYINSYTV